MFVCEMSCYVKKEMASHPTYGQGQTYLEVGGLEIPSEHLFLKCENVNQQSGMKF